MGLNKVKLGELIARSDKRNVENRYSVGSVRGLSVEKVFIPTKADMRGVSLKPYKLVEPDWFAYVTITSRNSDKLTIAHNTSGSSYIVSSSYEVFYVQDSSHLDSAYLFMLFNRAEFDRYARFNSWGSAREAFSWKDLCDTEIELPPIEIQRKYVAVYEAMLANQRAYEKGLDDLKLACDAFIERLMSELPHEAIAPYISRKADRNRDREQELDRVLGLSTKKEFRVPQSRVNKKELGNYKVVEPGDIAYVPTTDTWKVLAFAVNNQNTAIVVSPIYEVFSVDKMKLLPEYLGAFLRRSEFDRYARFSSWGSARENFTFEEMRDIRIPIPEIGIQEVVVNLSNAVRERRMICTWLKNQLKLICPILVRGAMQEAMN